MAETAHITRRAAFASIGAVASIAALAVPAAAAVAHQHTITDEQFEAIRVWRELTVQVSAKWDEYCKHRTLNREAEAVHAEWKAIYMRQQDAHIEMTRLFYPFERVTAYR